MKTAFLALPAALALALATPAAACDCAKDGHAGHAKAAATSAGPAAAAPVAATSPGARVVQLTVTEDGFVPAAIKVKYGQPVTLQVTRRTERTCATEIVMKDFGVNQRLPLGTTVAVTVTPKGPGAFRYACGMDMIAGVLTVE